MHVHKIILSLSVLLLSVLYSNCQVSGNANYQQRSINNIREIPQPTQRANLNELTLSANVLYNAKATSYVAVFSLTQVGESIEETDKLMNDRIDKIKDGSSALNDDNLKLYVDMISLVPVYEYESSKKIFSKKTYTEVPKGFEMKKNLHIRYTDPEALDKIVTICAQNEVYDLVKVDYYIDNTQAIYDTLRTQAAKLIKEKIAFYKDLGLDISEKRRVITEADQAFFPVERYTSYQAFSSYSLEANKKAIVENATKTTAQYYRPVSSRHYDIVNHAEIVEPAIQYTYALNVRFFLKDEEKPKPAPQPVKTKVIKEVHLILPNGSVKKINFE